MKRKIHQKKRASKRKLDQDGYEDDFDGVDIKDLKIVKRPDFVPSPAEMARQMRRAKITILLDDGTVRFFKGEAKKYHARYQQMIREVLRKYAEQNRCLSK